MGRNKEYTSDAVKDSVQAAMAEITAYFDKNWAPGREYDVIKHVHSLLDTEIDKLRGTRRSRECLPASCRLRARV